MENNEKSLADEIDSIKKELSKIKALLSANASKAVPEESPEENRTGSPIKKMPNRHPDPHIMALLDRLENTSISERSSGAVTYLGVYTSGGRQSTWIRDDVPADHLVQLLVDNTTEKVLACIGNRDRLRILSAVLQKPMTVAELIEACGLNSSGQVYHHMKPLLAADLIKEDNLNFAKGTYVVQPHKVQGIIMLLAGICDMTDETYSKGTWEMA